MTDEIKLEVGLELKKNLNLEEAIEFILDLCTITGASPQSLSNGKFSTKEGVEKTVKLNEAYLQIEKRVDAKHITSAKEYLKSLDKENIPYGIVFETIFRKEYLL